MTTVTCRNATGRPAIGRSPLAGAQPVDRSERAEMPEMSGSTAINGGRVEVSAQTSVEVLVESVGARWERNSPNRERAFVPDRRVFCSAPRIGNLTGKVTGNPEAHDRRRPRREPPIRPPVVGAQIS